jgi:lactoylglutathione lyase
VSIELPPVEQPSGHRTLFFRDPDGNVLGVYTDPMKRPEIRVESVR